MTLRRPAESLARGQKPAESRDTCIRPVSLRGRANAHKHDGHETAIYVLSSESGMWYGERLEQHLIARAGEFLYIPANMPHLPYNLSASESCVAVIARTDPNDQESRNSMELTALESAGHTLSKDRRRGRGAGLTPNLPDEA